MPNGTSHEPQFAKIAFCAGVGGFSGSLLAILLIYWLCGCPCGEHSVDGAPNAVTAPAASN